jgi:DhnA family fructose-bisphosphate aldolase class Ia
MEKDVLAISAGKYTVDLIPFALRIASRAQIGVFATQLGLIARYGMDYPEVLYLVKLNSKQSEKCCGGYQPDLQKAR